MQRLTRHRSALVAAALVAGLSAGTVVTVAVAADPAPSERTAAVEARAATEQAKAQQEKAERQAEKRAEKRAEKKARQKAKRAEEARAAAAEQAARSAARAAADPRALAAQMSAERYGWGAEQFQCLDSLWTKESGWDHTATNPSSGAHGIPQSLPGDKMSSHGSDWQTNPATQISWGLDYISQVYRTPCSAWGHSQAVGWY